MEERSATWKVAANVLNNLSRTAEKSWSSCLGVGRGETNSSLNKLALLRKRICVPQAWTFGGRWGELVDGVMNLPVL